MFIYFEDSTSYLYKANILIRLSWISGEQFNI
jgi:hypothetical protein